MVSDKLMNWVSGRARDSKVLGWDDCAPIDGLFAGKHSLATDETAAQKHFPGYEAEMLEAEILWRT
jgi:hypothetical protein